MAENHNDSTISRRNFFWGLWHGAFLALGMALTQPTTVIAAFVAELTGSTLWVGGLSTVLAIAQALPQLIVARWIEPYPYKMPFLKLAIYLRVVSWAMLSWMVAAWGGRRPDLVAYALVGLLALFFFGGGIGGVPYMVVIGKVIPPWRRGSFFAGRQILAAPLAIGGAFLARHILASEPYPRSYALLFGLAAVGLSVASLGFWAIREPADAAGVQRKTWRSYLRDLRKALRHLRVLVVVQVLTGFSLMALPFYVVFARQELGAPTAAVGTFLVAQVAGGILGNLVWARLVDRFGAWSMLARCALLSTFVPLLAIGLSPAGWQGLLPVVFLAGATVNGREVGFPSALLELAPAEARSTYSALNTMLSLPIAFLPLIAGVLLNRIPYALVFLVAAMFIGAGALVARTQAK